MPSDPIARTQTVGPERVADQHHLSRIDLGRRHNVAQSQSEGGGWLFVHVGNLPRPESQTLDKLRDPPREGKPEQVVVHFVVVMGH